MVEEKGKTSMEGSGGTECSKTCENSYQLEYEEDESEEAMGSSKPKDHGGGSSSNSTVEENDQKKSSVRPYVRSKTPRLRWTNDLHLRFVQAVERLGGQERATPKLVLQVMNIKGLNIAHVKSHLQMYRSKKIDDPNQVVADHRYLMEGGDRNIYNLSQLPMFQCYNQRQYSSFRYEDATLNGHHLDWMQRATIRDHGMFRKARPIFSCEVSEKVYESNYIGLNQQCTYRRHEAKEGFGSRLEEKQLWPGRSQPLIQLQEHAQGQKSTLTRTIPLIDLEATSLEKPRNVKRKALDCNIDLNLSLGMSSRDVENHIDLEDDDDEGKGGNLTLSLFSSSSSSTSSKRRRRLREEDGNIMENTRRTSTLDLTI